MSEKDTVFYDGYMKDGVVVLADGSSLPDGTRVTIIPLRTSDDAPEIESIYDIAKLAVPGGVPDLSRNIDHYLYGHPKASDAQP